MNISITNHTGARNRGCEALVLSKIIGLSKMLDKPSFTLHSNDPTYDAWRFAGLADLRWSYLTNTPNHFSIPWLNQLAYSVLGLAERIVPNVKGIDFGSIKAVKAADLVVASGGDIFTSDYGNLRKHLAYPMLARKDRLYLCSHSIGPFTDKDKSYFLRMADGIGAISAREKDSYDYLKELDVQAEIYLTADVAFTLPSLERRDAQLLLKKRYNLESAEGLVALSISQGIIKYSGLNREDYYATFARFCDTLIDSGKTVVLIPHVMEKNPDNNDVIACDEVLRRMVHESHVSVLSGEPGAVDLKGVIGCCECLIGTRTHATIAAMSQGIPTVSVAYSRKAYGIMKDVYGDELGRRLTIDARAIDVDSLLDAYQLAIQSPIDSIRLKDIKVRAENNFLIGRDLLP